MQVYRHMDIGTAKPTPEEQAAVRHHLIDVVEPDEEFNASIYFDLANSSIETIRKEGRPVFVVGGTGLYIRALTGGLINMPGPSADIRARLKGEMARSGKACLHEMLRDLDPASARRIHPNDSVRTIRALEALELTGESITRMQREHGFGQRRYECLRIGVSVDREELFRRIDERAGRMIENGLVEETQKLLAMGYGEELKPMQALGYRHIAAYLKGRWGLDEAVGKIKTDTRHYARRQLTWFRREPGIEWIDPAEVQDGGGIERKIARFLGI
jgi:tRNA dimethylallyltransferase